ncbi:hypothetical protein BDZ97DRAFT_1811204 [Flammula alnicola]|nr:hypothetical protein BDZ97DRAFT_1811204 [Flammula alnicola]
MLEHCSPPFLPQDLERCIFEIAAPDNGGSKCSIVKLMLVARRVNEWLRPILYRVFNQTAHRLYPDFKKFPSLKLEDVGHFAKHFITHSSFTNEEINHLLSSCPNVYDLAIWIAGTFKFFLPNIQHLRLRRLSAELAFFTEEDLLHPTLSDLTHLNIISSLGAEDWKSWKKLTKLPHLTHIKLDSPVSIEVVRNLVLRCTRLRYLIISGYPKGMSVDGWITTQMEAAFQEIDEDRIILLFPSDYNMHLERMLDWLQGAHGGMDNWHFAELIFQIRRQKYLRDPLQRWFWRLNWMECLNDRGREWYLNETKI